MIEIPEARTLTGQLRETIVGKRISRALAASSPHGFAGYFGNPNAYGERLEGRTITGANAYAGWVEIEAEQMRMTFNDGVNIRYLAPGAPIRPKHQLLLTFDDDSVLCCTVQMYGALLAFPKGACDNPYYLTAQAKPNPLDDTFDRAYFKSLFNPTTERLTAKAFLATEQRIPGLGNGVLQDILWEAKIHPRRKVSTLSPTERDHLFSVVKAVLTAMTAAGGRNTEKDLFGRSGGYMVAMCSKTVDIPCPNCGTPITRQAYLGGNVYFCAQCQPLDD
ncbi:MAG: hypothetical protein LBE83_00185 [Propionibacteriaceae bacterium]|jgi:formamidopyrimidine-DNA glycosylase|nr:hypothetical protein [Propionibacteriaceae bacterium]